MTRFPFLFSFFFVFVVSFLAGCAGNPVGQDVSVTENAPNNGILWKIEKPGSSANYVFGTMHSEDKRVTTLSKKVASAFSSAKIFAMEVVLDKKNTQKILKGMYFDDGRTLKSITSKKVYLQSIEAMAQRGMPERIVNLMKPWSVFTVLSMPEQETGLFLDAMLYEAALKNGKEIIGLETTQEQLDVFDKMDLEIQLSLLESTLESGEDLNKILDETLEIYLTRDLNKILDLNNRYTALLDKEVAKAFNKRLLVDRNIRMVKRMIPLLEKGNAFVAIGALHLPGKIGVLNILQNAGYAVTAVD